MIRKSTLVVVILFLLLLAVAFYLTRNPLSSSSAITPTPTEQAKMLPDLTAQQITSLELKPAEGEAVRVEQDAQGNWVLESAAGRISSFPGKIEQARDELTTARVTATLPAEYSLAAVGLNDPQTVITVGASTGQTYVLQIGSETPTRGGIYVQVNDSVPVVVNTAVIDTVITLLTEAASLPEGTEIPGSTAVP